jgi:hypothetical protein
MNCSNIQLFARVLTEKQKHDAYRNGNYEGTNRLRYAPLGEPQPYYWVFHTLGNLANAFLFFYFCRN